MKDSMKVKIEKYDPTKDWLNHGFYKTTFPILSQPAQSKNDICGTGFLLDKNGIPYIITAKHVANIENPVFLFTRKGRKNIFIHTAYLNQKGITWNFHPKFDLATIKFPDYIQLQKKLDNYPIIKKSSNYRISSLPGSTVRHLGYPEKSTGKYKDGSPANIPIGMVGKIVSVKSDTLILNTPAQFGASGGPLFVKTSTGPDLIGVVTRTTVKLDPKNILNSKYTGTTTAVAISHVYDIMK